ncbi:MAG TPA: hypothetical protein PKH54_11380 [Myxococcota bacterium]|nr:hypothetical protein [Myxococcota bacterium]
MKRVHRIARTAAAGMFALGIGMMVACGGSGRPNEDILGDAGDVDQHDVVDELIVPPDNGATDSTHPDSQFDISPGDVVNPTATELVALGMERLSAGESLSAMDAFSAALALQPGHQPALWGMVLARFQSSVAMFSGLTGLVSFRDDPDAEPELAPRSLRTGDLEWPVHEGTIGTSIDALYHAAIDQQQRIAELVAAGGAPFTLETGLPLNFRDDLMMNLCCDWDISDLYGISSFNNLMLAFVSFLGSQETDVSLAVFEETADLAPGISNVLVHVMDNYPDLFALLPEDGATIWQQTGDYLLAACRDALEAARLMAIDNGMTRNVATLSDDEHPYLVLHGSFPGDRDQVEFLWDGVNVSMKDVVTRAEAHLAGTGQPHLSLDEDVLVAIAVFVDIVHRTVGIETLAAGLGFELPDIVTGLIGSLDQNDPEQLAGLLPSLTSLLGIPAGTVYMDVAGFLDHPFNLRDLFPNYGDDPGTEWKTFTRSFECMKAGCTVTGIDSGDAMQFWFMDSTIQADTVELTVSTFPTADTSAAAFETETITLEKVEGFDGLLTGTIVMMGGTEAGPADDGRIVLPDGGQLVATFVSPTDAAHKVSVTGNMADGFTPWDYGAACGDDDPAWDAAHFWQSEFATAVEVTAPGTTTPLGEVAADGETSRTGFMAFKSPSFNGLLWLKDGDQIAAADQASFARIFAGVLKALEDF